MKLIVSPLRDARTVIKFRKPSHLVSLLEEELMSQAPKGFNPERHLKLSVHDIWEAERDKVLPDRALAEKIIAFGKTWDGKAPMLVHCWAGVSRSTATAFILACARNPNTPEKDIAWALRDASEGATPNPLLVHLADDVLGREGRMLEAIRIIGRGRYVYPGAPFELPANF